MVNLVTLASAFAYIQGSLPVGYFSNIFAFLSLVSLVPSVIGSLLGPILSVLSAVRSALSCITAFGGGIPSGAGGVAAVGAGIFMGDIGAHATILAAVDTDKDEDSDEKKGADGSKEQPHNGERRERATGALFNSGQFAFLRPPIADPGGGVAPIPMPQTERSSSTVSFASPGTAVVTVPPRTDFGQPLFPVYMAETTLSAMLTPRHAAPFRAQTPQRPYVNPELVYRRNQV